MISVVVPAYNAAVTLGLCLDAIQKQTVPRDEYEIIVVDDGSTDGTSDLAWRHAVRLVQQPNAGPGSARNLGARVARGWLLLFTDADCVPAPDWIERMSAPFVDSSVVGAKGTYRTRQESLVPRFVQLEYEDRYARTAGIERIDFVDTYSAAYRRDTFVANGGFDTLLLRAQDQELSFRLARKGYHLVFQPQAIVYHQHDWSISEYWSRKRGTGRWKALLLRWHPERAVSDSHTPQVLKLQIGLVALLIPVAVLTVVWPPFCSGILAIGAVFVLSALPFLVLIARRDSPVLLVAPLLILVRALALGVGLAEGSLKRQPAGETRTPPIGAAARAAKRLVDIVVGIVGLLVSAPLVGALGAAIKLDSTGPAIFVQQRIGENGRPFRMYKLRTMLAGADEHFADLVDLDALDSPAYKLNPDPRVTRVGAVLRRWSLDELPQLWNVLRGEMSLVGPRPEQTRIVELYTDAQRQRLAVKPGLTGPMQVSGRADLTLDERIDLELGYIRNYSLWEDFRIIVRTVGAVVAGRGAC